MNNQQAKDEGSQSEVNSSTSSYSEIIPRQDLLSQLRKDKPIVMRSIPVSRAKQASFGNIISAQSKNNSFTLISSTHYQTNLEKSNISGQYRRNESVNEICERERGSEKVIGERTSKEGIDKQILAKSMHDNYSQQSKQAGQSDQNQLNTSANPTDHIKNQQPTQSNSQQQYQNILLNYSTSSLSSSPANQQSPKYKPIYESSIRKNKQVDKQEIQKEQLYIKAIRALRQQEEMKKSVNGGNDNSVNVGQQQQKQSNLHQAYYTQLEALTSKNATLANRITQLQSLIKTQSQSMIMQRKANQIYTQFYHTLSKAISKFIQVNSGWKFTQLPQDEQLNESVNMEKILLTIDRLTAYFMEQEKKGTYRAEAIVQTDLLLGRQDQREDQNIQINTDKSMNDINYYASKIKELEKLLVISQEKSDTLRKQLLQSTQNNITAIFNTELSASCCLENQVTKINSQLNSIKQQMNVLLIKQTNPLQVMHPTIPPPPAQIILIPQARYPSIERVQKSRMQRIYTGKQQINQSSQQQQQLQQQNQQINKKRRKHSYSQNRNKKSCRSSSSSISSKSTKKRQQVSLQQIQNLKQAYNSTKHELNALIQTFSLITSGQHEMKVYFSQVKEDLIRSIGERLKEGERNKEIQAMREIQTMREKQAMREKQRIREIERIREMQRLSRQKQDQRLREIQIVRQNQRLRQLQILKQNQQQTQLQLKQLTLNNQQHQSTMTQQLKQQIQQQQKAHLTQIQQISNQRHHDRRLIESLNGKIVDLINAISVPQRVSPQMLINRAVDEQVPVSYYSISVDYLKQIQHLKSQNQKQSTQINRLLKHNQHLKDQIQHMKGIEQRSRTIKVINNSVSSSRERNQSIINQLNGFTEMSIPLPGVGTNTSPRISSNIHIVQQTNVDNSHLRKVNFTLPTSPKHISSVKVINHNLQQQSQRNIQNNFKTVLASKQSHIRHLEQEVTNLQQTIQYLKEEVLQKQKIISDLQNYISNLQNRSLNSISVSNQGSNVMLETNPYLDHSEGIKIKYQNYVKNLKILLKQTRSQNKLLREQLLNYQTQADQLTQSNFNLKNSATHSQRTTKNFPNSTNIHATSKGHGQIVIRKRQDNIQKRSDNLQRSPDRYDERQEQRINSFAFQNQVAYLPEQTLKIKGKSP